MGVRDAFRNAGWLAVVLVLVGLWLVAAVALVLLAAVGGEAGEVGEGFVGTVPQTGAVGLIVLVATLGLFVLLLKHLGEADPLPEEFPPR